MNLARRRAIIAPMRSVALFTSPRGQISPRTFGCAILGVYLLSFLSQVLISPPLIVRTGLLPFLALQVLLAWSWIVLHVKRLRDGGYSAGPAVGIAILYALAIVQLVLLLDPMIGHEAGAVGTDLPQHGFLDLWTFVVLISAAIGQTDFGFFDLFVIIVLALILIPILVAIAFSIWTGTRAPAGALSEAAT
jgi:uncharacterized membrane protein YhaH (DUF805 family)